MAKKKAQGLEQDARARWEYPLDPECPDVKQFYRCLCDDPMTEAMGAPVDEIGEAFERRHRAACKRCQKYGVVNVGVK